MRRCKCGAELSTPGATYCRPCAVRAKREWLATSETPAQRERRREKARAYSRAYYVERKIARFKARYCVNA